MKYKEQISALKIQKIKDIVVKAYWLFLDKGIDNVTLEDVAKASEISPITMYRYFGDKKTLLIMCGEMFWKETYELNNPTKKRNFKNATGYEQTEMLMSAFIPAVLKYPQHLRFLRYFDVYMEQSHTSPKELKEYDAAIVQWRDYCHSAFEKGINDKTIRADLNFESFYFTTTHMLMAFGEKLACSGDMLPSDSILSKKKQIEYAIEILLSYIQPQNAKKK